MKPNELYRVMFMLSTITMLQWENSRRSRRGVFSPTALLEAERARTPLIEKDPWASNLFKRTGSIIGQGLTCNIRLVHRVSNGEPIAAKIVDFGDVSSA